MAKTVVNPDFFFRGRTVEQKRADEQFGKACDALSAALMIERHEPTAENKRIRRAAEKAWEQARQVRDKAREVVR